MALFPDAIGPNITYKIAMGLSNQQERNNRVARKGILSVGVNKKNLKKNGYESLLIVY